MEGATLKRTDWRGIRGAIVDLDGTMVDTAGDFHAAVNAMLQALSHLHPALGEIAPLPLPEIVSFVGKGSENLIRRVLDTRLPPAAANGLFADALALYNREYLRINGQFSALYPGVEAGLAALKAAGLRLACVTNKPHDFTAPLLDKLGLAPCFELVYGGDAFPFRKPDPLPLLKVCEAFRLEPAQMVAIGDSENDAMAARAAGIGVLLVPYGYNHGNPVQGVDADGIVGSLVKAAEVLTAHR
ncbi:phosphoglycolate phosphatase [Cupriavidus gilardii CR3]|uniref:Phosphoglycolate phosphatase n=1 Tax=Cupriavidus gilardii TaxID=82541 RepID=A0A6N1BCF0_9BURK|nr:phosphoglycolate phosphatase [Cupriavidus gilardii]ALD91648.1 phosphoglycolate phosphatase [Cupriavidus gilardii CR3]KAB0595466.1 phosphoglycolate phosphatase [Cupriavidus gilardii]MCT9016237.1 phosphoglycolate phosphatase [Cupriavidus gilardii]MCT9056007.1 phosphoglycolate phosphatase [Cupriavidus gilardii]MCT9074264.1 phosphoglycolate phosphatase [Cupriavidus gilardii]